jgi:AAA ATPase-like protein
MARAASRLEVLGREQEREHIAEFLDEFRRGPAILLIEGEAGIGKTTLWEFGVAQALDRGHTVLVTRAGEADTTLAYTALGTCWSRSAARSSHNFPVRSARPSRLPSCWRTRRFWLPISGPYRWRPLRPCGPSPKPARYLSLSMTCNGWMCLLRGSWASSYAGCAMSG